MTNSQIKPNTLLKGIQQQANEKGVALTTANIGGMFGIFFTEQEKVETFAQVQACDGEKFKRFFHLCLEQGVYLAPSAFEAGFVSSAHTKAQLDKTIAGIGEALAQL